MIVQRWAKLAANTPFGKLVSQLNELLGGKGAAAAFAGGAKADGALDDGGTLQTGVSGTATIAGKSAGGIAAAWSVALMETFDTVPDWTVLSGTVAQTLANTGQTGGKALRQTGPVAQEFPYPSLAFDASKLYRLRARVKRVSGTGTFSYGLRAYDASDALLGSYAIGASLAAPGSGYTLYTGWCRGFGAAVQPAVDPLTPSGLPSGTVAVRPYYVLNAGDAAGVMDLDLVDFDRQDEEAHARTYETLLPSNDAARTATGAGLYANTVDSPAIQTDAVIARTVKAGAITADKITVVDLAAIQAVLGSVTTGLIQDPSGAYYLNLLNNGGNVLVVPGLVVTPTGATFSGIVAADTFTAPLAIFTGAAEAAGFNTSGVGPYQVQGDGALGAAYALRMGGGGGASYLQAGSGHSLTLGAPAGVVLGNNTTVTGNLTVTGTISPSFSPPTRTITGSRGGNAALASLIGAMVTAFGWTDSTTP